VSRNLLTVVIAAGLLAVAGCGGGGSESPPSTALQAGPHPVAGNFKPDDRALSDCKGSDTACLEQAFGNISYDDGPKTAMRLVEEKMRTDVAVKADCHRIVHMVGSAALARYDGNVPRAFAEGSSTCWSGYYHGILERSFYGATTIKEVARRARRVCDDPGIRRTTFLAYQCVHGLGHGLMINMGYDLPTALKICDGLATKWDQTSCTGGVFMENISSSYGIKSKWLKDSDLVYPCDVVKERHKLYCYLMVTSRILQSNGYDWKATAKICSRVEKGWVATCYQSFGRDASGFTHQNPPKIVRLCRITGNGESDCIYGASRDLTSNDANGKRAAQLCNLAPAGIRVRCFSGIGTIIAGFSPSAAEHRAACSSLTQTFLRACLRGAGDSG
jgi:hypothetical protein